jgi:hypothetical protein
MIDQVLISSKSLSIFGVFASRFIISLILSIAVLFFSFVFMFLSCSLIVAHKISSGERVGFVLGLLLVDTFPFVQIIDFVDVGVDRSGVRAIP